MDYVYVHSEHASYHQALAKKSSKGPSATTAPPTPKPVAAAWRAWGGDESPLLDSQLAVLGEILQDHAVGFDCCVLAPRGAGKSVLVRQFAAILGYGVYAVFCHQDMASHELLQRRTTDAEGSTLWQDSPLLLAAVSGQVSVQPDCAHSCLSFHATLAPASICASLSHSVLLRIKRHRLSNYDCPQLSRQHGSACPYSHTARRRSLACWTERIASRRAPSPALLAHFSLSAPPSRCLTAGG